VARYERGAGSRRASQNPVIIAAMSDIELMTLSP